MYKYKSQTQDKKCIILIFHRNVLQVSVRRREEENRREIIFTVGCSIKSNKRVRIFVLRKNTVQILVWYCGWYLDCVILLLHKNFKQILIFIFRICGQQGSGTDNFAPNIYRTCRLENILQNVLIGSFSRSGRYIFVVLS